MKININEKKKTKKTNHKNYSREEKVRNPLSNYKKHPINNYRRKLFLDNTNKNYFLKNINTNKKLFRNTSPNHFFFYNAYKKNPI